MHGVKYAFLVYTIRRFLLVNGNCLHLSVAAVFMMQQLLIKSLISGLELIKIHIVVTIFHIKDILTNFI